MKEEAVIRAAIDRAIAGFRRKRPRIVDGFELELRTDMDGQEAAFVTVVLSDRTSGDYSLNEVRPIEDAIRRKLSDEDPDRYPYVSFELKSEQLPVTH